MERSHRDLQEPARKVFGQYSFMATCSRRGCPISSQRQKLLRSPRVAITDKRRTYGSWFGSKYTTYGMWPRRALCIRSVSLSLGCQTEFVSSGRLPLVSAPSYGQICMPTGQQCHSASTECYCTSQGSRACMCAAAAATSSRVRLGAPRCVI